MNFYLKKWREMLLSLTIAGLLALALIRVNSYPPLVKELYLRNPLALTGAAVREILPGEGIDPEKAKAIAKAKGAGEIRSLRLIYLTHVNSGAKGAFNARDLYFASLSKEPVESEENLFWYITGWQEQLLMEYKTGQIIYYRRQDQVLVPSAPEGRGFAQPVAKFGFRNYTREGIKTLFFEEPPQVYTKFADRIRVKGRQDFEERLEDARKDLIKAFLRLEEETTGQAPPTGTDKKYLDLLDKVEGVFAKAWGDGVQEQMIIPTYMEKAAFENQAAWVVFCNWAPANDLEKIPGAKEKGIPLARQAVLVISAKDYSLLFSLKE